MTDPLLKNSITPAPCSQCGSPEGEHWDTGCGEIDAETARWIIAEVDAISAPLRRVRIQATVSKASLSTARQVIRLATVGIHVRSDEQERELQVAVARKISDLTGERVMRNALQAIELRMREPEVSDASFRQLVTDLVDQVLAGLRAQEASRIDPERLLPKVAR